MRSRSSSNMDRLLATTRRHMSHSCGIFCNNPGMPPVRAIWAMDIASAGQSFLLNKADIGDEPHWYDPSRDIVQMINHFHTEIRPPLIGFGQSWGAVVLAMAASSSPRLFQGLILSEPVFESGWYHVRENPDWERVRGGSVAASIARRKRYFGNRTALMDSVNRLDMWKAYDPRVLHQILCYDYRDLEDGRVELITPPLQTLSYFLRPSPPLSGFPENEDYTMRTEEGNWPPGFYNAQGVVGKRALAKLKCPLLLLWETTGTFISNEAYRRRILESAEGFGRRRDQSCRGVRGRRTFARLVCARRRQLWPPQDGSKRFGRAGCTKSSKGGQTRPSSLRLFPANSSSGRN